MLLNDTKIFCCKIRKYFSSLCIHKELLSTIQGSELKKLYIQKKRFNFILWKYWNRRKKIKIFEAQSNQHNSSILEYLVQNYYFFLLVTFENWTKISAFPFSCWILPLEFHVNVLKLFFIIEIKNSPCFYSYSIHLIQQLFFILKKCYF